MEEEDNWGEMEEEKRVEVQMEEEVMEGRGGEEVQCVHTYFLAFHQVKFLLSKYIRKFGKCSLCCHVCSWDNTSFTKDLE